MWEIACSQNLQERVQNKCKHMCVVHTKLYILHDLNAHFPTKHIHMWIMCLRNGNKIAVQNVSLTLATNKQQTFCHIVHAV